MLKQNSTFCSSQPSWANACVGENGSPGFSEYAKGFSAAANLLIEQVIGNSGRRYPVDTFIYPICFNMRHSVELRLKQAIEDLQLLVSLRKKDLPFSFQTSHDIFNIWSFFKTESTMFDKRFSQIVSALEPTIVDIAEVDPSGQTFRYPSASDNKKHLTEVAVISIFVLREKFQLLEKNLDELDSLMSYLLEEYRLGSFTATLSRHDLFEIARELPARDRWKTAALSNARKQQMGKYGISSNEFSKALKVIEKHHQMGSLIGITFGLNEIDTETIYLFLDEWIKVNPRRPQNNGDIGSLASFHPLSSKDAQDDREILKSAHRIVTEKIPPAAMAELESLFYFGRDCHFPEEYEAIRTRTRDRLLKHLKDYDSCVFEMLQKQNFLMCLVSGLNILQLLQIENDIRGKYSNFFPNSANI